MNIDLEIKNYRCFGVSDPVRLSIHNNFIALIGLNNSGKSTLLKFFYEFRPLLSLLSQPVPQYMAALVGKMQDQFGFLGVSDREQIFNNNETTVRNIIVTLSVGNYNNQNNCEKVELTIYRSPSEWSMKAYVNGTVIELHPQDSLSWQGTQLVRNANGVGDFQYIFKAFGILAECLYIGPFRNIINTGGSNYFDIQVGKSFIDIWGQYKAGGDIKNSKATLKLTQDIKHIFGFDQLEINTERTGNTLQIIADGQPYVLDELGSGLAQFIIVLTNALTKNPSYILIDEPELNLHPSLQIDFLTTLASYAKNGIVFATHNIGLARAVAETIYSVKKDNAGKRSVTDLENMPSLAEFLGEMSFAGYRDLGYDKVLLVEGTTEVKTVQQLLRKYKADHRVVILPLGGTSLIRDGIEVELAEIQRLSDNIFALIDSEKNSETAGISKERTAFIKMCHDAGIKCHTLHKRATENYFTDRSIKQIKGEKYTSLGDYGNLTTASLGWSKDENWKIAREMTLSEIAGTDLDTFLKEVAE